MGGVLGLRHAGSQHLGQVAEGRLQMLLGLQAVEGLRELASGSARFAFQRFQCRLRRIQQGLGVGQPGVVGVDLVPFVLPGRQLVDFGDLPGQALAFALQRILVAAGVFQRLARQPPGLPQGRQHLRPDAAIGIEQCPHGLGPRQALPGVLAMDVHQLLTQLAQLRGGGGAAVDPGPALALAVDAAAQQQAVFIAEARFP